MHNPPEYENVALQSRWSVGLKTPLLMLGSFILAFLVAILHAILYEVLKDTPTEGPESLVPQTYVTTISIILASIFTLLIHFCLGLSFTQYLWYTLRRQPLAILTIERLFTLRSNPLSLFDRTVFQRALPLVIVAFISWSASIVISFPPGAITVVANLHEILVLNAEVPTFNVSDFGDMKYDTIRQKCLFQLDSASHTSQEDPEYKISLDPYYSLNPTLYSIIHQTLLAKRLEHASSTCSVNCSYSLHFTGPYVQCTETTNTSTILYHDYDFINFKTFPMFNSSTEQRSIEYDFFDDPAIEDPPVSSHIVISTSSPQNIGYRPEYYEYGSETGFLSKGQWKIETINHYWACTPSRAEYTVHTTYKDNVRSLDVNIDKTSIQPLMPAPPSSLGVERNRNANLSLPLNPAVAPILRDANLYSIITPVMNSISGTFNATCTTFDFSPSTHTDSGGFKYYNFTSTFPENRTVFNNNSKSDFMSILPIVQYFSESPIPPSFSNISVHNGGLFTINETSINAMLQDVVISILSYQPNNWTTRVNQKRNEMRNIYTYSRPLNLFLPYGLMLLGSLCALSLGFYALRSNGVPATDGGFLQLFTTAQKSDTVDRMARGGCLGGEENVPRALKDLKIQFGELVKTVEDSEVAVLSTAGFGTEHEVRHLKRERIYGSL